MIGAVTDMGIREVEMGTKAGTATDPARGLLDETETVTTIVAGRGKAQETAIDTGMINDAELTAADIRSEIGGMPHSNNG